MHSPLQINHFRWKDKGLWLLKAVVLVGCVFYISKALSGRSFIGFNWQALNSIQLWLYCTLVLLLVPFNWLLEVIKWKLCVVPLSQLSTRQSLRAVLTGLSLNWIIPFTLGDFIGRSLNLPKTKGVLRANLVNRFTSLWTTLLMFGIASYYYWPDEILFTGFGLLLLVGALLFAMSWDKTYHFTAKLKIVGTSVLRYLIFSLQFALLLFYFCPEIPVVTLMAGIPVVFLIRTLAPSMLGALGVREAAVIWTFAAYATNPASLLLASLFLWAFNIVLPSIVGLFPVITYRYKWAA